jgi:hypothetical protein
MTSPAGMILWAVSASQDARKGSQLKIGLNILANSAHER